MIQIKDGIRVFLLDGSIWIWPVFKSLHETNNTDGQSMALVTRLRLAISWQSGEDASENS